MACVCLVVVLHMPPFTEGAGHCTRCGMVPACLQGMHCLCGRYRVKAVQTSHDQAIENPNAPDRASATCRWWASNPKP